GAEVAVPGGRDGDGRVVESVEGGEVTVDVPVAVPAQEHDRRDEKDETGRGQESNDDEPQCMRRGVGEPDDTGRRSGVSGDDPPDVRKAAPGSTGFHGSLT